MALRTRSIVLVAGTLVAAGSAGCMSSADLAERTALAEKGILKQRAGSFDAKDFARYYSYWPQVQVYHSAWQDRYYWQDGYGRWKQSTFLPEHIELPDTEPELVELFAGRPFIEHKQVLAMYPPDLEPGDEGEAFATAPTE